ncbi:Integrase core domain [Labeo rohita]|uniref:Integrase core domain n=1 Tax=Labeo rohita TaxID=84645 RepID=A0A498NPN3_LABRO|nr:Integrase core domain [Labeo rohita]
MEDAIAALKAHFAPRRIKVAERHAFRKRVQAPGESIVQYVAALRDLASTCDFAATLDEMLRDQLVENVSSHRIRERLLLESELTLDKAITIASQIEAAGEQAKFLSGNRSVPVQAIHAKPTTPPASGGRRRRPPLKPPPAAHASKPSSTAPASLPPPKDGSQLRSFTGLLSWYNKFIPNFATVIEPLRACIRQGSDFVWSEEAQQCFDVVKNVLVQSRMLSLFNPMLPTVVSTDASSYGLGAVLAQIYEDKTKRIVAFASRTLSSAERKYSTIESLRERTQTR